ncbi:MAG: helix-turn-helix domain-containing protein [Pseudomonadota bacterium]
MYVTLPADADAKNTNKHGFEKGCGVDLSRSARSYVYHEGDEVTHLYQVQSGIVRLSRVLRDGRRQIIAFGFPGDIVGFPSRDLHHTDCEALTETRLRPIKRAFLDNQNLNPDLNAALLHAAMDEISAMQDHFMMLGCKSALEKVASFLTILMDRQPASGDQGTMVDLPMSRTDIGDFLGLSMETVSRSITQLRKAGLIRMSSAHSIEVLATDRLRDAADGTMSAKAA